MTNKGTNVTEFSDALYGILQNVTCPQPQQVICPPVTFQCLQDKSHEQEQNKINVIFWIALITSVFNVFSYIALLYEARTLRKRIHSEIKFHGTTNI